MSRHVVFGTGQIGRLVAERLVSLGADVTAVNRSGRGSVNGAQVVAGDATDPVFTTGVGVPLGLDIARLTNFAGYVSWCGWLVAMAIVLWRAKPHADGSTSTSATVRHRNPAHS
jgi:nucleoside-diphosphate-sugar epimerase